MKKAGAAANPKARGEMLLAAMSLAEKVGQLVQVGGADGQVTDQLRDAVAGGQVGSIINEVDPQAVTELQRIAREEAPHGIPLLIGRDVIHGFKTIFPIPLGMAASWNPLLVEASCRIAAREAAEQGVNWTFSPMLDVSRDPRWGRIAESFGEDPLLTAHFGAAMVRGYQNGSTHQLISCLKHFVGYGACEAGKDYNTTNIPEIELRNVYLPPFEAGVREGAWTLMPSFSDLNGMPPSGNRWLLREVLRDSWGFEGLVVSDWASITQLAVHGVAADDTDSAAQAAIAGVTMDMASGAYAAHLERLVESGALSEALIDGLVLEVLTVKFAAGLFDAAPRPYQWARASAEADQLARTLARESVVLLKNAGDLLPLVPGKGRIALLGPLADQPDEQLGTWVFDGDIERSQTLRSALEDELGERLEFDAVLHTSRDRSCERFEAAAALAAGCDAVVLALGEEAILSGEAHCRAELTLPGAQEDLVRRLAALGKPLVVIVLAGRPLLLNTVVEQADAVLYAWHPGTMTGPALADLLFGRAEPCGRLPVTLPRAVGQVPIYYAHGHTGKPATPETVIAIDDIDAKAPQTSVGNTCFHLDVDPSPLFPFGFGLTYTDFDYRHLQRASPGPGEAVAVSVEIVNRGSRSARAVVQLYVRDLVASATRPVRELKDFALVELSAGGSETVRFALTRDELSFFNGRETVFEPGRFRLWVGGDANADMALDVDVS